MSHGAVHRKNVQADHRFIPSTSPTSKTPIPGLSPRHRNPFNTHEASSTSSIPLNPYTQESPTHSGSQPMRPDCQRQVTAGPSGSRMLLVKSQGSSAPSVKSPLTSQTPHPASSAPSTRSTFSHQVARPAAPAPSIAPRPPGPYPQPEGK